MKKSYIVNRIRHFKTIIIALFLILLLVFSYTRLYYRYIISTYWFVLNIIYFNKITRYNITSDRRLKYTYIYITSPRRKCRVNNYVYVILLKYNLGDNNNLLYGFFGPVYIIIKYIYTSIKESEKKCQARGPIFFLNSL